MFRYLISECFCEHRNSWRRMRQEHVFLIIFCINDFGVTMLSQIWSSDSIFVRCRFVDVLMIQGRRGLILDERLKVSSRAFGTWSWRLNSGVRMVSSRAVGLDLDERMNGSSRAFGLDLEEWMCGFVDVIGPKGRWGLILGWTDERIFKGFWAWSWRMDEWMMNTFFKGRRGLILNWWKVFKGCWGLILGWMDERWTLSSKGRRGLILNWMEVLQGLLGLILKNGGWICLMLLIQMVVGAWS